MIVSTDLIDVTLVSDDTFGQLYLCDSDHDESHPVIKVILLEELVFS